MFPNRQCSLVAIIFWTCFFSWDSHRKGINSCIYIDIQKLFHILSGREGHVSVELLLKSNGSRGP